MILLVKNEAEYDQPITMHTGEEKVIIAGSAIRVNIGTDKRLMGFYASLISSNFEVDYFSASDQEVNNFNDAKNKLIAMRNRVLNASSFQDNKEYPSPIPSVSSPELVGDTANPLTLDNKVVNKPIPKVTQEVTETQVPRVARQDKLSDHVTVIDSKIGEVISDLTPILPSDYPDDPAALAEVRRLEEQEKKLLGDKEESDKQWYALDELTEDQLKKLLVDEFGENTRLKNKSKIIYHIIELASEDDKNVYELADKYQG